MPDGVCPICRRPAERRLVEFKRFLDCRVCGKYIATDQLEADLEHRDTLPASIAAVIPFLSAYIRAMNGQRIYPTLTSDNWPDFARAHSTTAVSAQASRLLSILGSGARPGGAVPFDLDVDYPLLDAASGEEAFFLIRYLLDENYIASEPAI